MAHRVTIRQDSSVEIETSPTFALDLTLAFRIAKTRAGWESSDPPTSDKIDISVLGTTSYLRSDYEN